MGDIFLKILSMSINTGWIVLAVILIRLMIKKAPKWITVLLWCAVAIRLLIPFSFESMLSLLPSKEVISTSAPIVTEVTENTVVDTVPNLDTGVSLIDYPVNEYISESFVTNPDNQENFIDVISVIALVWILGIAVMLIYSAVSYIKLRRKVMISLCRENNVYYCDNISSPFILGIIKPKIYIPSDMAESDISYVLSHEYAHIKRMDHLWKILGFLMLSVHWFNPLLWVAYALFSRDVELATDEKAIKNMKREEKLAYSTALINCSTNQKILGASPLSFGEVSVKDRIKNVLSYKKPPLWVMILAVVLSIVLMVGFLTDPPTKNDSKYAGKISTSSKNEDFEDKVVTSTTTTVSGGGAQGKTEDGKGNVSTVIPSDDTSTTKAPDKIINKYDKIGDLDLDYVKKIKANYRGNQDINLDEIILTYCATLSDGSVALYINQTNIGHPDVMVEDYIANKYFYNYSSGKGMLIYKDGQFFSIKLAYENGKITKEVLDEIFQKYPQLNSTSKYITADDYLGGLDIKAVIKAKEAYFAELYHIGKTEYSAIKSCKDIKITNCGTLSDGTVLIKFDLKKPISNPINIVDEVGKYKYEYKLGYDVRIIAQGKNYNSVKYAYQKNQISSKIVDEFFAKLPEVK